MRRGERHCSAPVQRCLMMKRTPNWLRDALRAQGASCGWMDASVLEPPEFNEAWSVVLLVSLFMSQEMCLWPAPAVLQ